MLNGGLLRESALQMSRRSAIAEGRSLGPARPILRVDAPTNETMKGRVRPFHHRSNPAVLDRVEMHVIHVCSEIRLALDRVLPITPMPDTPLALLLAYRRQTLGLRKPLAEQQLDQAPARRIIRVPRRQAPDAMQMIRQHHPGHDLEGIATLHPAHGITQSLNMPDKQIALALQQGHREEIRPARHEEPPIIRHIRSVKIPIRDSTKPNPSYQPDYRPHRRACKADSARSANPPSSDSFTSSVYLREG